MSLQRSISRRIRKQQGRILDISCGGLIGAPDMDGIEDFIDFLSRSPETEEGETDLFPCMDRR